MTHEDIEALSAFVDNELTPPERSRIEGHLRVCETCREQRLRLEGISRSLAELPEVFPTADERRGINQAVFRALGRKVSPMVRWAWALGGVSVLAIALVGVSQMLPQTRVGTQQSSTAAAPPSSFETPEEIRAAIVEDPVVRERVGEWVVADVGKLQPEMLRSYDVSAARAARAPTEDAVDSAGIPAAGMVTTAQGARDCMEFVLRSQDYPMLPVYGRSVTYKSAPAWLLVFAFTTEREEQARLDRIQVWVVSKVDCSPIHYAYFKP